MALWLFRQVGRIGFSPSDEGTLHAQTFRILHGQIPYKDFFFARPVASAYFHLVDWIIPLPLFEASRLVGIIEFVAYSMMLASYALQRKVSHWNLAVAAAAACSVLVNIHTFFLTSWYTLDGLVCVAGGLLLLSTGSSEKRRTAGLLLMGLAPLMKQSFFLAPIIGLLLYAFPNESGSKRNTPRAILVVLLPAVIFGSGILAAGAFGSFLRQVLTAKVTYGQSFVIVLIQRSSRATFIVLLGLIVLLLSFTRVRSSSSESLSRPILAREIGTRLLITALLIQAPLEGSFSLGGTWAFLIAWTLLLVVVWEWLVFRVISREGLVFALLCWMTSLSWGYGGPNFVAGSTLLYILYRLWLNTPRPTIQPAIQTIGASIAAIALFGVVANTFIEARNNAPYVDTPSRYQTIKLGSIFPALGSIRTNPTTAEYMSELAACIKNHPAASVAVLPDNPAIYPALRLHNPFPIDWMLPEEIDGHENELLRTADSLSRRGHYLVLFQTVSVFNLRFLRSLPSATATTPVFFHGTPLGEQMIQRLHGTELTCGSFIGRYSP